MTYAEREQIFAKEVLSIDDFAKLHEMDYNTAAKKVRQIKMTLKKTKVLRDDRNGKLHIQDYFDYYGLKGARYERMVKGG